MTKEKILEYFAHINTAYNDCTRYETLSNMLDEFAIEALRAQADNIPEMHYPQVDGITPTVVAQADGEKTCGTCRNEDTYHCAECENKSDYEQAQADGEYISRQAVMDCFKKWQPYMATRLHEFEKELSELPSVAIPPEHDGCKDCKYETYPDYYYPCCECKQNYTDEWQKKPHWIEHEHEAGENWEYSRYECSECHEWSDDDSNFCPNCGAKMVEPQESEEDACKDCYYNDGEVHAECVICDKAESEDKAYNVEEDSK